MRIRLFVEGIDLDVSRAPVQDDGFAQRLIGLEPHDSGSRFTGESLQPTEKPPPQAEPLAAGGDPHPL
jgi:hypothetical protein